jgi:hypothetical protein
MVQKPIAISVVAAVTVAAILILMLTILATISSTNQAFAQQKPTTLTINVSPTTAKPGSIAPISVTGKLTSEGSGVGGATITFTGMSGVKAVTDADGTFSTTTSAVHMDKSTNSITAHYAGDATHMSSNSPSKVIIQITR